MRGEANKLEFILADITSSAYPNNKIESFACNEHNKQPTVYLRFIMYVLYDWQRKESLDLYASICMQICKRNQICSGIQNYHQVQGKSFRTHVLVMSCDEDETI